MDSPIIYPRRPISELLDSSQGELSKLLDKFDMFREISTRSPGDAVKFAYLEHIMRVSTPIEESKSAIKVMLKNQQAKLLPLIEKRNEGLQDSLHGLDAIINRQDLNTIRPIIKSINYKWDGKRLNSEENEQQGEGLLPICYVLTIDQIHYLLYTPNLTYVDGYDPFTGETKFPMIPDDMLKILSKSFYVLSKTKSMQVQTDPETKPIKKKKKMNESESETSMSRSRTPSIIGRDETLSRKVTQIEPTLTAPEEINVEEPQEIEDGEQTFRPKPIINLNLEEEEEESSIEESETDEPTTTLDTRQEIRTWEKYEKKATKKQKSRDQCAPVDGCVLM